MFGLHKELNELSQGNNNTADYFTKLKMLWDDIESLCLVPMCTCGYKCGASQKLLKFQQDQKVIQLLMGLNDNYAVMRGSILLKSPFFPTISQVYNILLHEESEREIHSGAQFISDSTSLAANSRFQPGVHQYAGQFSKKVGTDSRKSTMQCNYCKKPGHTIDKCYKLHGFPADFKFNKHKRFANSVSLSQDTLQPESSAAAPGSSQGIYNVASSAGFSGLSPELCSQLVNLLKSAQIQDVSSPSSANFAGNSATSQRTRSEQHHLNYEGFYTILLEKNEELITVGTVSSWNKCIAIRRKYALL